MAKILLIDDDTNIIAPTRIILERGGHEVLAASSGKEGIQLALEELPDLVLCDIMMPYMDGYGVLAHLRNNARTATLPFIFLTAKSGLDDLREGMNLGADDYITKPFNKDEFLIAVQTRLDRYHQYQAERLRQFANQIVRLQEAERQSLADTLEKHVSESLSRIKLTLSVGENQNLSSDYLKSLHAEALTLLDEVSQNVHSLTLNLYPVMLSHLGLVTALLWLFEQYPLHIEFRHQDLDVEFTQEIKNVVFRVLQELLNNTETHAETENVMISMIQQDGHLHINYHDDGVGFDLNESLDTRTGVGIMTINERVLALNGDLVIQSQKGEGTTFRLRLPLHAMAPTQQLRHISDSQLMRMLAKAQDFPVGKLDQEIRVAIAYENHPMFQGIRPVLERNPNFVVVAEIQDLSDAPKYVAENKPEVLLINPIANNKLHCEIMQTIVQKTPETGILVLTAMREQAYVREAFRCGAKGYLPQDTTINDLLTGIVAVARNQYYLSPEIPQESLLEFLAQLAKNDANQANGATNGSDDPAYQALTEREREILKLVSEGLTNGEVADKLNISVRTVETHRANVMKKLDVKNHSEMIKYAIKIGLTSLF